MGDGEWHFQKISLKAVPFLLPVGWNVGSGSGAEVPSWTMRRPDTGEQETTKTWFPDPVLALSHHLVGEKYHLLSCGLSITQTVILPNSGTGLCGAAEGRG